MNKTTRSIQKDDSGVYLMRKVITALLLIMSVTSLQTMAATLIDAKFNALPGDKVELEFIFDEQPPEPKVYAIDKPARLALDLDNTTLEMQKRRHTLDMGNARSVALVQADNRTRLVVNMLELTQYESTVRGNSLFVTIGNTAARDYLTDTVASEGKTTQKAASQVNSIDFRRGEDGEGRLVIELSNPNVNINSTVEGRRIKLSFENTGIAEELQLDYDVSDFATPVLSFNAKQDHRNANIEVVPSGQYDYLAYQADNTYVLTIKPMTQEQIEEKKKEFAYVGDKLSLNFQDIEVRSVLQLIADFTDFNLVASDTVGGKITLRLQNVPWDQALDLILKTKGLDKRVEGNVLMIAPAAEIARREQQEVENNKQRAELAPLQTEFIRVRYALATDVHALLLGERSGSETSTSNSDSDSNRRNRLLSSRATIVVDQRTNSLLITETGAKLEEVRKLINLIDVPVRQVVIEARIVSAYANDAEKLGIAWGVSGLESGRGALGNSRAVTYGSGTPEVNTTTGVVTLQHGNIVDLGITDQGATQFNLGFISGNGKRLIDLQLSAIESSGHGEVVTQPKIITGDKQEATIKSGRKIPYQETSPNGASTVAFEDAVLELSVTPNITPDDRIIMELNIKQDSVGDIAVNGTPVIDTNEIMTNVLVANGETVVLGGVFETQDRESLVKTPFFGDLPLIGRFFRKTETSQQKTELLIFITPRILSEVLTQ